MQTESDHQPDELKPGDIRIEKRGPHAGTIEEVIRVTETGVKFRVTKPGNSARRKESFDPSAEHLIDKEEFMNKTMPLERAGQVQTQPAFRQNNQRRKNGTAVVEPGDTQILQPTTPPPEMNEARGPNGEVAYWVLISPDMARNWLERGGLNRHLNINRVDNLNAAIHRDEWRVTGDTVKLDAEGRVRDGQHRLEAIIKSARSVWSLVVFGVQEDAFDVMDTGRSRSVADVIGMRGYPDRNVLGSTVRNLIMFETAGRLEPSTRDARTLVTTATTLAYLRLHGEEVMPNVRLAEAVRQDLQGSAGMWAAVITLMKRINVEDANEFIRKAITGEGLSHGDPILILRNRLTSKKDYWAIRSRGDREALAASIIKAWNAWRKNETFESWRNLHWRSEGRSAETFPRPE